MNFSVPRQYTLHVYTFTHTHALQYKQRKKERKKKHEKTEKRQTGLKKMKKEKEGRRGFLVESCARFDYVLEFFLNLNPFMQNLANLFNKWTLLEFKSSRSLSTLGFL